MRGPQRAQLRRGRRQRRRRRRGGCAARRRWCGRRADRRGDGRHRRSLLRASRSPAPAFCADFDDDASVARGWTYTNAAPTGDGRHFASPPRSVLFAIAPDDAGRGFRQGWLSRSFARSFSRAHVVQGPHPGVCRDEHAPSTEPRKRREHDAVPSRPRLQHRPARRSRAPRERSRRRHVRRSQHRAPSSGFDVLARVLHSRAAADGAAGSFVLFVDGGQAASFAATSPLAFGPPTVELGVGTSDRCSNADGRPGSTTSSSIYSDESGTSQGAATAFAIASAVASSESAPSRWRSHAATISAAGG